VIALRDSRYNPGHPWVRRVFWNPRLNPQTETQMIASRGCRDPLDSSDAFGR
jgi:hypothetical protein